MKTTVVSLIGGPGCGKSTLASLLFYKMKLKNLNCELINEYIKEWVYAEINPNGVFNQLFISANQFRKESLLFNKVEYVITDSPILLGIVYDYHYNKNYEILNVILEYIKIAKENNVEYKYFYIKRSTKYNEVGRFQPEQEAIEIDELILKTLKALDIQYEIVDLENASDDILKKLNIK
jgi:ABC-type cobalamin/Fe3+-siderophores transport system ATPase subunit